MQTLNPCGDEEYLPEFPPSTHWDYNFAYQICVADDDSDLDLTPPAKKRKLRHDHDWKVSIIWNVIRSFYCSDDRSRPMVDADIKTATFQDMESGLFIRGSDENGVGVIDRMLVVIGRIVEDGVPFDDVGEMIARIRRVVCGAVRSGRRREGLDIMVTVRNQSGLPRRDYEALLREKLD